MRAKKHWLVVLMVLPAIAVLLDRHATAGQGRFHSEENGYSITVPTGWTEVPKHILLKTVEQAVSPEAESEIFYETAFQRVGIEEKMEYPYAAVQIIAYSKMGLNRQIHKSEFEAFVKGLSGLDVSVATESFSTEAQETIFDIAFGKAYLDKKNKCYMMSLEADVANIGKVRGIMVGHFGRRAIIQIMFYDLKSNWSQSKPEREVILESFRFDPSMTYDEAFKNKVGISDRLSQAAVRGIGYGLLAGVLGLICGLFKLITNLIQPKKKSNDEQRQ